MLRPTANFKMEKQNKRFLATIIDPHKRGEIKRSMIQAQLQSQVQYRPSKGKKDNQGE